MADNSGFESRTGIISCTPEVFFNFICDIRNLEQFIPEGRISDWTACADSCSFNVSPIGEANIKIASKAANSLIEYAGEVLKTNNFFLSVKIAGRDIKFTEVKLIFTADLNPMLRMMASGPIEKLLELLISEMEKFDKWNVQVSEK